MQKTIVVELESRKSHPLYGKIIRTTTKVKAHDENEDAGVGDRVSLMETRPTVGDQALASGRGPREGQVSTASSSKPPSAPATGVSSCQGPQPGRVVGRRAWIAGRFIRMIRCGTARLAVARQGSAARRVLVVARAPQAVVGGSRADGRPSGVTSGRGNGLQRQDRGRHPGLRAGLGPVRGPDRSTGCTQRAVPGLGRHRNRHLGLLRRAGRHARDEAHRRTRSASFTVPHHSAVFTDARLVADRTQSRPPSGWRPSRSSPTVSRTVTAASRSTPRCCRRCSSRTVTTPTASANGI